LNNPKKKEDRALTDKISHSDLLQEIVEATDRSALSSSDNYPYLKREEYAEVRCRKAEGELEKKLRLEAKTLEYGFIYVLPLYEFDLDHIPRFKRPHLSSIKSPSILGLVDDIQQMGYLCFIDIIGLSPVEIWERHNMWSPLPIGAHLGDSIAPMDCDYFEQIGVPIPNDYRSPMIDSALYALLPGQDPPKDSGFRRLIRFTNYWLM